MNQPTNRSPAHSDLIAACRDEGCPVCRLSRRAAERYIDSMLNDALGDVDVELRFVAARGLCERHAARLMDRSGQAASIAQLHRAVLNNVLSSIKGEIDVIAHAVRRRWSSSDRQKYLAAMLNPHRACPACEQEDAIEHQILAELRQHLFNVEFVEAFQSSAGLCLPHFRLALMLVHDETLVLQLIDVQRPHFQRLADQLGQFIRQNDPRFSHEGDSIGRDSWRRAIEIVSGHSGTR